MPCGVLSDPFFRDFTNSSFEFLGDSTKLYNIFTDNETVVNMRLAEAGENHIRMQSGEGTFADQLAFNLSNHKNHSRILVEISEQGDMSREPSLFVNLCGAHDLHIAGRLTVLAYTSCVTS